MNVPVAEFTLPPCHTIQNYRKGLVMVNTTGSLLADSVVMKEVPCGMGAGTTTTALMGTAAYLGLSTGVRAVTPVATRLRALLEIVFVASTVSGFPRNLSPGWPITTSVAACR